MEMKLILKNEDRDKNFYNELLYISSKHPNIVKNPNMKVHSVTSLFTIYLLVGLSLGFACILLYFLKVQKWALILVAAFMVIDVLLSLFFLISSIRYIKKESSDENDSTLTINNSGIRITRGKTLDYKIDYDKIIYVIINNHTLVFLPSTRNNLMIAVPSKYKKEIVKELKDLGKEDLIIDNSKFYK